MGKKEDTKAVSDREILQILEQAPSRGMELLIGQYSGLLWSLANRYLNNQEDQKDCINETFEQFYYNRKRFDPDKGTLSSYLAGIFQKRAITLYRKNSRYKWEELSESYPAGESGLDHLAENLDLEQALASLKPEEFELIRMKYYEGMTVKEIAASLHISYETVKKRHQRTLSKLQKMLLLVLAMVLAGLLTACAIRILQHFGIIPGYGVNQNQEERVFVLEEPVEGGNEEYDYGIEDAVVKEEKVVLRLWMKEKTQAKGGRLGKESERTDPKLTGQISIAQALEFRLSFDGSSESELASQVTSWNKDGTWYKELIFQNVKLPENKKEISHPVTGESNGKGVEEGSDQALLSYTVTIRFGENSLKFKVKEAAEEDLENYPYSFTQDGGILADPVLEDGHLLVSIYPLNIGAYQITPSLIRNMYAYNNEETDRVTVTGPDGTVKEGECIGYHPEGTEEFFQWDFGEGQPGKYTLRVPFVYETKQENLHIPLDLKNKIWSHEEYPISGGTLRIKKCEKIDQEEDGSDHWKLQLAFTSDDSRRSLAALPLSMKYQELSEEKEKSSERRKEEYDLENNLENENGLELVYGNIRMTQATSDVKTEKNIMEYDLEIIEYPPNDSPIYLTTQNQQDSSIRDTWYLLDQSFQVTFEAK